VKGLLIFAYGLSWGWLIRKSGSDKVIAGKVVTAWEAMQRRSAQIQLDERDKRLLATVALFSDSEVADASS
jgi:hypothetical protein